MVNVPSRAALRMVLQEAAEVLREWGWTREHYHLHETGIGAEGEAIATLCDGYCMVGAIQRAAGFIHDPTYGLRLPENEEVANDVQEVAREAELVLGAYLQTNIPTVWNDKKERTQEEAIAALEGAASTV